MRDFVNAVVELNGFKPFPTLVLVSVVVCVDTGLRPVSTPIMSDSIL